MTSELKTVVAAMATLVLGTFLSVAAAHLIDASAGRVTAFAAGSIYGFLGAKLLKR